MKNTKKYKIYTGILLFDFLFVMILRGMQDMPFFTLSSLVLGVAVLIISLLVGAIFDKIVLVLSHKSVADLRKSLLPAFLLFTILTFLIAFVVFYTGVYIAYRLDGWDTTHFIDSIFRQQAIGGVISVMIVVLLSIVLFFYTIWRQAVNREQLLREENLKYQYRTLKTQVNPHFLFNSLNVLSEIIYVDVKRADCYIQKLSGIYRYILDHEKTDLIALEQELEFVRQYFSLQQERDEDKIRLEVEVEDAEKYQIVPISLQILVENALKHNLASKENPLEISIRRENDFIIVSNRMQRKNRLDISLGTGLANLKERVRLITGKKLIIKEGNSVFEVQLPIVGIKE